MSVLDLQVKFQQRRSSEGHPFTELLFSWRGLDGLPRHALSRVWWTIDDTAMNRAREMQAFMERRAA